MPDRILTWFIDAPAEDNAEVGPVFVLGKPYSLREAAVRLYARKAPDAGVMTIDILDDGVTIFPAGSYPALQKGRKTEDEWDSFRSTTLVEQYSIMTLKVRNSGGANGITVSLELQEQEVGGGERERYSGGVRR